MTGTLGTWAWIVALGGLAGSLLGCSTPRHCPQAAVPVPAVRPAVAADPSPIQPASWQTDAEPAPHPEPLLAVPRSETLEPGRPGHDPLDPFAGQAELSLPHLLGEVEARNPSLIAMTAAWQAAAAKYPQVVSLDDPMFGYMQGLRMGWMVEASQKFRWPGKRVLAGDMASAEASAAGSDYEDTRLRLAEAARMAFFDYYLARREMEVNRATRELMKEFREIAKTKYESGEVPQQDVLQADLELANLEARQAELTREEQIAAARINTLLHRDADLRLPPPPANLELPGGLPEAAMLQSLAVSQRPDLSAGAARICAEEAAVDLACKEFYPDVTLVAKYDSFMPEEMRPQVGLNVDVPIRRAKRCAALSEAQARLQQRRAEYQARLDQISLEVQSAYVQVTEADRTARLYREKILPAAQSNAESAKANYTSGKIDFLRLLDAQQQFYREQEKSFAVIANYHRRLAELDRAVGGSLPLGGATK